MPPQIVQELVQALRNVEAAYFNVRHWNNTPERRANEQVQRYSGHLSEYGERAFCYELYHQLRLLNVAPEGTVMQGEARKNPIPATSLRAGESSHPAVYVPDFLIHSPSDRERQYLVMEVKTNPEVAWPAMKEDLEKLVNFQVHLQYQTAVYLLANNDLSRITNLLKRTWSQWQLDRQHQDAARDIWLICCHPNSCETPRQLGSLFH